MVHEYPQPGLSLTEVTINGVHYVFDEVYGRTVEVYGNKEDIGEMGPRDKATKVYLSKWPNAMKKGPFKGEKGEYSTGHIFARDLGGADEGINLFVQLRKNNTNKDHLYQQMEDVVRDEDTASFRIVLHYEGNHELTDIPSSVTYSVLKQSGKQIVEEIPNPPEVLPSGLVDTYRTALINRGQQVRK